MFWVNRLYVCIVIVCCCGLRLQAAISPACGHEHTLTQGESMATSHVAAGAAEKKKLLIVGAGLTGSLVARLVGAEASLQHISVTILDKGRGPGGRATTLQLDNMDSADLGLQYLSTDFSDPTIRTIYDELQKDKVIAPFTARIEGAHASYTDDSLSHFAVLDGARSLSKHFLAHSNATALMKSKVVSITKTENKWKAHWETVVSKREEASSEQRSEVYDSVVITSPVPQIIELNGDVSNCINEKGIMDQLKHVQYSARWVMAVQLPKSSWSEIHHLRWDVKYVKSKDKPLCYVAIDQKRRGSTSEEFGPMLVLHAGVPWSIRHAASKPFPTDEEKASAKTAMIQHAAEVIPWLSSNEPQWSTIHKWRFSQVYKHYEGQPGAVEVSSSPLLVLAGDAFIQSNFDNTVRSAQATVDILKAKLGQQSQ